MTTNNIPKRKCAVCEQFFEPSEYYLHINEEVLKQLVLLNGKIDEMNECMQLTYTFMQDDNALVKEDGIIIEDESVNENSLPELRVMPGLQECSHPELQPMLITPPNKSTEEVILDIMSQYKDTKQ
jgi:hypothetical protein